MSFDTVHTAQDRPATPEPEGPSLDNRSTEEQEQVAPVEKPMIIWRSLMLEQ